MPDSLGNFNNPSHDANSLDSRVSRVLYLLGNWLNFGELQAIQVPSQYRLVKDTSININQNQLQWLYLPCDDQILQEDSSVCFGHFFKTKSL